MRSVFFHRWMGAIASFPFIAALRLAIFLAHSSSFKIFDAIVSSPFLSDPFLPLPTPHSVWVVWFTEFPGLSHSLISVIALHKLVRTRMGVRNSSSHNLSWSAFHKQAVSAAAPERCFSFPVPRSLARACYTV